MDVQRCIDLQYLGGDTCLSFDAKDVLWIRRKHRMIGTLIGTSCRHGLQNLALTLPLQFTPNEVTLGLKKGWFRLKRIASTFVDTSVKDQKSGFIEKEEEKRIEEAEEEDWEVCNALWTYPRTRAQQIKYQVYETLHARGYFIGGASKFGAHFMAYPGDPMRYHGELIVYVQEAKARMDMALLVALGRLAVTVRKVAVLASVSTLSDTSQLEKEDHHEHTIDSLPSFQSSAYHVEFTRIRWEGIT